MAVSGAVGVAMLTGAAPAAADPSAPAANARAACVVKDATSESGQRVAGSPVRFRYPDTPYVGARFSSCTGKISIYFGGFKRGDATHYNIRWGTNQYESPVTNSGRILRFNDPGETRPGYHTFKVQACNRGSGVQKSGCTRWSPEISMPRH